MNVYLLFPLRACFVSFVDVYFLDKGVQHCGGQGIKGSVAFYYLYEAVCIEAVRFKSGQVRFHFGVLGFEVELADGPVVGLAGVVVAS